MQGDQVKALKIVSKAKGWDPDRIWNAKTRSYEDSIENFNQPPQVLLNQAGTGRLPEGIPDSFPEASEPKYGSPAVSWNAPEVSRENANRRTNNSDPTPGMPGA